MVFVWMTVTVSTPHVRSIPTGTKLVFVNRAHIMPWLKRLLLASVFFALLVAALRGDSRDIALLLGEAFGFLAIVTMYTLFIAALGMDRSLTSVKAMSWIHWRYTPQAWAAWRDVLVSRTATGERSWKWTRDWWKFTASLAIVAVVLFVVDAAIVPVLWNVSYVVFVGILIAATIEIVNRFGVTAPERLRRVLLKASPETYAGAAGIFCDGVYVQWVTPSYYLVSATVDERAPRCINLEFAQIVPGASLPRRFTQSVLIPPDADDDMRTLQTRLAALFPSATVALAG